MRRGEAEWSRPAPNARERWPWLPYSAPLSGTHANIDGWTKAPSKRRDGRLSGRDLSMILTFFGGMHLLLFVDMDCE